MCRLFPCIPIFRGFFWLKSVKRNVFAMGLKNAMLPMKSVFINVKKGISKLGASLAANHTIIIAEVFLKLAILRLLINQKSPSLPSNLSHGTFGELPVVLSTKVKLLYLLYSTARRCCLLHLAK